MARSNAPRERWSIGTGGDIRTVAAVASGAGPLLVALAGSVLQAFDGAGRLRWSLPRLPVSRLIATGDLDGTGEGRALVRVGTGTLVLLDARDGSERWRWRCEPGTFIHDHVGVLLVPLARGHRLVVCPTYASEIHAFDLAGPGTPRHRWSIGGPWDAGFGPSVIAADMDGDGRRELVLSSRIGAADRTRGGRTTSAERVLGRRRGELYQAIHDLDDGTLRGEVAYAPVARGWRCARPYGLLAAAPLRPGTLPGIVLVSCQVEEYVAVTRRSADGGLARAWGHLVEKDWPVDERELRATPDALGDLDGDGRQELVVSLWQDGRWRTIVLDPDAGWGRPKHVLEDRVSWGTLRGGDGATSLVTSVERARATGGATTVELRDGRSLAVVARRRGASVVLAEDAPLPPDVAFMAQRRAGTIVRLPGGRDAIVLRRWRDRHVTSVAAWSRVGGRGELTRLAGGDAVRVDEAPDGVLVSRSDGTIERAAIEAEKAGRPLARRQGRSMRTQGREARSLVRSTARGRELVVEQAGGRLLGGRPAGRRSLSGRWRALGSRAALVPGDRNEQALLVAGTDGTRPTLARLEPGGRARADERLVVHGPVVMLDAPLDQPALPLPDGGVALTLRTGVHTLATELRDADLRVRARVGQGAYLHPPTLLETADGPLLVLDDHGILLALGLDGRERWRRDWTAAYCLPITGPFGRRGTPAVLRASGIHGLELVGASGRRLWRREAPLWTYAAGPAAVLRRPDGAHVGLQPRRDGVLEAFTVESGDVRWRFELGAHVERAVTAAADVDGEGGQAFLVGLPDGRLLCLAEIDRRPDLRWELALEAGITDVCSVDVDGDGRPEIVAATSDGVVRVLA